jgi:hypothetical protein
MRLRQARLNVVLEAEMGISHLPDAELAGARALDFGGNL